MLDRVILLIPSLNPDAKLIRTIESMSDAGFDRILIVNDGSDEDHLPIFNELAEKSNVQIIGYEKNQGKGYALKYGFQYILDNYQNVDCVLTADGDGQHMASDCVKTAEAALERDEIVFGCRNFKDPSVPKRNRAGNTISIFVYNKLCGIKISDTQTGLRAFPVRYLKQFILVDGSRFEYETNMLLYMHSNSIGFSEVAIHTVYEEGSNKGSHFKVFSDSAKIYRPVLKYALSRFARFTIGSLLSAAIDLGLFTLLGLFKMTIPAATAIARVCSSVFNYCFNKSKVFRCKTKRKSRIFKYYLLAAVQMCASALIVTGVCKFIAAEGIQKTGVKLIVDIILFIFSYIIQRNWVFKEDAPAEELLTESKQTNLIEEKTED